METETAAIERLRELEETRTGSRTPWATAWLVSSLDNARERIAELEERVHTDKGLIENLYRESAEKAVRVEAYVAELKGRIAELEAALRLAIQRAREISLAGDDECWQEAAVLHTDRQGEGQ